VLQDATHKKYQRPTAGRVLFCQQCYSEVNISCNLFPKKISGATFGDATFQSRGHAPGVYESLAKWLLANQSSSAASRFSHFFENALVTQFGERPGPLP
jgi:hypothetical protein